MASAQRKTRRAHERLTTLQEDVAALQAVRRDQATENRQLEELLTNARRQLRDEQRACVDLSNEKLQLEQQIAQHVDTNDQLRKELRVLLDLDSDAKGLRRRLHAAKTELATRNTEISRLKKEKAAGW